MARSKLEKNISRGSINRANKRLYKLMRRIILTKQRDSDGHILRVRTGNLKRNIRPILSIDDNNNIVVDIETMDYFVYLDEGTRFIKPWYLSEAVMDSEEFESIIEDLYYEAMEEIIFSAISKFN